MIGCVAKRFALKICAASMMQLRQSWAAARARLLCRTSPPRPYDPGFWSKELGSVSTDDDPFYSPRLGKP
jgi:hypothetical protein